MAILSNLIVNGSGRILNKLYVNDLVVGGSSTFEGITAKTITASTSLTSSGTLTVTGVSTLNGSVTVAAGKTLQLLNTTDAAATADNSTALIIGPRTGQHLSFDQNEIMAKATATTAGTLNLNIDGGSISLGGAPSGGTRVIINNGAITSQSIANKAMITTENINVANTLRATRYDLQTISQSGGSLYISPTIKFPNTDTSVVVAKSGTTLTITITDSSIKASTLGGIAWAANCKVKCSGEINGVATGTMDGTITSINTSSGVLVISVSGENSGSVVAGTYSASQVANLSVMVYMLANGNRVGMWLNCYDIGNNSASIRVYGGTATDPNVMLGNLTGASLPTVNSTTPTGWGLYAQNAFLQGTIVSTSGKIGGWTLDSNSLKNGTWGSDGGALLCTGTSTAKSIGGSAATVSGWVLAAGAKFGVTKSGDLYCNSANISGTITATAGAIGGFKVDSTSIRTNDVAVTSNADNSVSLSSADFTRTIGGTSRAGLRFAIGDKMGITGDGIIYGSNIIATGGTIGGCSITNNVLQVANANITSLDGSKITANSITTDALAANAVTSAKIKAGEIDASKLKTSALTVGGRNILRGTMGMKTGIGTWITGTFRASGSTVGTTLYTGTDNDGPIQISDSGTTRTVNVLTLKWTTEQTEPGFCQGSYTMKGHIGDVLTMSAWVKVSRANMVVKLQPYWTDITNKAESCSKDFTIATANKWTHIYYTTPAIKYDHAAISIGYVYIVNKDVQANDTASFCGLMLEWGCFNSDWSPAPDEIAGFTIDGTSIHTANVAVTSNATNSIALSNADFTRTVAGSSRAGLRFAIGSNFGVSNSGVLYCSSADISGKITATSGAIGGFTIGTNALSTGTYGSDSSVFLSKTNMASKEIGGRTGADWRFTIGSQFGVTNTGALYCSSANISGQISSTGGTIGGFTISQYGMRHGTPGSAGDSLYFGRQEMDKKDSDVISGTITIGSTDITNGRIIISDTFAVTSAGQVYATSATIGGLDFFDSITLTGLYAGDITSAGVNFVDSAKLGTRLKPNGEFETGNATRNIRTHDASLKICAPKGNTTDYYYDLCVDANENIFRRSTSTKSSIRYKTIIRNLSPIDVDKAYNVQPVWAKWKPEVLNKDDGNYDKELPMMIAEDWYKQFPEVVLYNNNGQVETYSDRYIVVLHQQMLINQRNEIDNLKQRIKILEDQLNQQF